MGAKVARLAHATTEGVKPPAARRKEFALSWQLHGFLMGAHIVFCVYGFCGRNYAIGVLGLIAALAGSMPYIQPYTRSFLVASAVDCLVWVLLAAAASSNFFSKDPRMKDGREVLVGVGQLICTFVWFISILIHGALSHPAAVHLFGEHATATAKGCQGSSPLNAALSIRQASSATKKGRASATTSTGSSGHSQDHNHSSSSNVVVVNVMQQPRPHSQAAPFASLMPVQYGQPTRATVVDEEPNKEPEGGEEFQQQPAAEDQQQQEGPPLPALPALHACSVTSSIPSYQEEENRDKADINQHRMAKGSTFITETAPQHVSVPLTFAASSYAPQFAVPTEEDGEGVGMVAVRETVSYTHRPRQMHQGGGRGYYFYSPVANTRMRRRWCFLQLTWGRVGVENF
ncbi:unnamed protein product [Vitrella brassicaformis CCMP3155]|uniref:Uncharacterized protein n=2 Tax=Vitrella brassicaformis TaxID=1169539 RepID=A0A0G4FII7_VITBC|nr:unnamed protein product [Vitrella brassicaformis CCMP3155]|eukprot:CEM13100.1 unnamed protein product [Vitrella brassicaformis CCMP3155]